MGVRPSLDGLDVVDEKVRREWNAGTRKDGRVITDEEEVMAFSRARPLFGANIVWLVELSVVVEFATHLRGQLRLQKCSGSIV